MNLTEKQIEDHKAWLQDQKPAHQAYVGVLIADKLTAAESALEGAKARFCINPDAPVELIFTADKILVNTRTPEPGKNPMGHVALNVNAEQAEKILATLREHQALQSRLDAAERDAARMDWLVKMKATVYAAFEVGETMVQHWVTVDERGKERHGCVAETLRESIDKAIAEQPNLIDAFNGRAPFPDIAALSASAPAEAPPPAVMQLPPLNEIIYHAVSGLELDFGSGEDSFKGTINDDTLDWIWESINTALRCANVPSSAAPLPQSAPVSREAVAWAVERWNAEVRDRPIVNKHRRSLDDVWRQVIRKFGGDPDALIGPSHDYLAAHPAEPAGKGE